MTDSNVVQLKAEDLVLQPDRNNEPANNIGEQMAEAATLEVPPAPVVIAPGAAVLTPKIYVSYVGTTAEGDQTYNAVYISIPTLKYQVDVETIGVMLLQQQNLSKIVILWWRELEN